VTGWGEAAFDAYLPADMVLGQADIAVVVTDRLSNLLYINEYAVGLFRISGDVARLAGCSVLSLGMFAEDDVRKTEDLAAQVLHGRSWEGTLESIRGDGARALIRAFAVPLRHPGGDIDGIVILAREASKRDGQGEQDRIALLERVGERLAGSLEIVTTLKHVAEMLVPQFADHCFIDLYQGEALVRRVQRHANDWVPPPGTWAQVGEQIHYPEGHFCQQAMTRLDTIAINDLESGYYPAPSAESMSAAHQAGLTSVIAAPLYARGELLGVMSLALSRLTERDERQYDTPDRDLIGAIASRVAIAIDNAMLFETERQTALAFQKSLLPQAIPELDGLEVACRYVPAKPLETQGQGLVRHHPAGGRAGRHCHRRRRGQRGPGGGDHGSAACGPAGVRAGREVARGHHAQARRVVPVAGPRRRERDSGRRGPAHRQLHLHDLRRLVQGADLR
jgi:hypothetical protein